MIRFPQLLRWIQWDAENSLGINIDAETKAIVFDKLLTDFNSANDAIGNEKYKKWLEVKFPNHDDLMNNAKPIKEWKEMGWLSSQRLFDILMFEYDEKYHFKNALECNVW
jgi:hypothetical protein